MNTNYFSKVRILDGGLGQQILAKGLKPKGSLWSGTALIDKKYHQIVIDSHLDFIKSGADVIVTNNFAGRRFPCLWGILNFSLGITKRWHSKSAREPPRENG